MRRRAPREGSGVKVLHMFRHTVVQIPSLSVAPPLQDYTSKIDHSDPVPMAIWLLPDQNSACGGDPLPE